MTVANELDKLRTSLPGCSLVTFGDLFSKVTLCASARSSHKQEQLDSLCVTAGGLLDGKAKQAIVAAMNLREGGSLSQAGILGLDDAQFFFRSPVEEADVLCCVGSLNMNFAQASVLARSAFQRISEI